MPRGKKFTAAEKHFLEKERKYQATVQALEARNKQLSACNDLLKEELEKVKSERDELLELTSLNEQDIKSYIIAKKKVADVFDFCTAIGG